MNNASFNYVRTYRLRECLTEEELAFLINQRSHTAVSAIETGRRLANLEGALALQVLFREEEPKGMFPGLFEHVEEGVMRRALVIIKRLEGLTDAVSNHKRAFLEGLARPEGDDIQL
jgi:DNA-binding XRE family transcriptional regulator